MGGCAGPLESFLNASLLERQPSGLSGCGASKAYLGPSVPRYVKLDMPTDKKSCVFVIPIIFSENTLGPPSGPHELQRWTIRQGWKMFIALGTA